MNSVQEGTILVVKISIIINFGYILPAQCSILRYYYLLISGCIVSVFFLCIFPSGSMMMLNIKCQSKLKKNKSDVILISHL